MKQLLITSLMLMSLISFSQETNEKSKDTISVTELEQVVVTGQYNPQSIKKSVHNITVIDKEQIKRQAANSLADLLNFNLNLTVISDSETGQSTISFFGFDSQYVLILVDNVPLVSDNGLGNNVDLTQINLDDVERIEVVEGAMGVEYGANAVTGVINIITKKSSDSKWKITATLQEETVSDEYEWFDKGRHVQAVTASHNINDNWYTSIGFNRNDFAGFFNNRQGKNYYENDGLRGYDWLPKEQYTTNALLSYNKNNHKFFYKFEYFNEEINFYNPSVRSNIDVVTQTSNPSATDRIYTTNRFYNHINGSGNFKSGVRYNVSLSYQQQKRRLNEFNYFILTQEKTNETDEVYQSSKVFFSKGSLSNLFQREKFKAELGYEVTMQNGFDTEASGSETSTPKSEKLNNFAIYGSSEIQINDNLSLRPGMRFNVNSKFDSKFVASLTARQQLNNGLEIRANFGSAYRTPNFQELYYYFVDANHDVRGNENLKPEDGVSAFLNFKKTSWIGENTRLENQIKFNYLNLSDKIELAVVNFSPLQYEYINIDTYKLWGITTDNTIKTENWNFGLGASLLGMSRELKNEANANDEFLYNFQLTSSTTYYVEKWKTAISLIYKFNGKQKEYSAVGGTDTSGNSNFSLVTRDSFHWLDASIKKSFFNDKIETTLGARNLLDVTRVNSSFSSTSSHGSGNSFLLGYGRSFYLKLLYKLNF